MSFPFTKQPDAMDCGPACICMIAELTASDTHWSICATTVSSGGKACRCWESAKRRRKSVFIRSAEGSRSINRQKKRFRPA